MVGRDIVAVGLLVAASLAGCSVNQYFLGASDNRSDAGADGGGGDDDARVPCIPEPELCDDTDNDCDGKTDETFHLEQDPANCGTCGHVCSETTGTMVGSCANMACTFTCLPGLNDVDPAVPGCEYACIATSSVDLCDGVDNDCDGGIDENVTLPGAAFCRSAGACSGAAPVCSFDACSNSTRIHCTYGADVEIDPASCGVVTQETPCDDTDNDCDGAVDEAFPNKGADCDDGNLGVCRTAGILSCNSAGTGVECDLSGSPPPQTASPELCNGKDDDCNGSVDDNAPDTMVQVGSFRIDAYEASRPDATALSVGVMTHRACSNPLTMPWSTVTRDQAAAACAGAGKRLCTAAEWELACAGAGNLAYPYGNTYQANTCNGNDYDPDCALPDADVLLPTGSPHGCPKPSLSACVSTYGAFDMSGNLKEWTSTPAGASAFKVRGGGYDSPAGGLTCTFDFVSMDPSFAFPNLGFRCCAN